MSRFFFLHHGVHHHKKHPEMSKQESREERTHFVKGICDVTFLQVGLVHTFFIQEQLVREEPVFRAAFLYVRVYVGAAKRISHCSWRVSRAPRPSCTGCPPFCGGGGALFSTGNASASSRRNRTARRTAAWRPPPRPPCSNTPSQSHRNLRR